MGNLWSNYYPSNAPKYRRDWIPDIRSANDNKYIIRNTRYDLETDITQELKNAPSSPVDNPLTMSYQCGSAYAVCVAYFIALQKCKLNMTKNAITEDIFKYGPSVAFLYWNARVKEGVNLGLDIGCSIRACLHSLLINGMVSENKFPLAYYGVATNPQWLQEEATAAPKIQMHRLTKDPRAIIQALSNHQPVIIGYVLHEQMIDKTSECGGDPQKKNVLRYICQDSKDQMDIRGGYAGVIVHYDANTREFLLHGTPFPNKSQMIIESDTIRSTCVGDIWCIEIMP